jgi:phenylacetate-CoA ligase
MLEWKGYPFERASVDLEAVSALSPRARLDWQQERKWEIARFHAANNPAYRALIAGAVPTRWDALPVVTKALFQRPLSEGLSQGYRPEAVHTSSTSGSSGEPFFFARDKYTHARTWALIAQRYGWHGLRLNSRQARFYGIPLEFWPRLGEMAKDRLMNRARFPVFDLSDPTLGGFRRRIARGRFDYLYGYTNSLLEFARYLLRIGAKLAAECPSLKACVVTSEMCTPADRGVLAEAFGVPIVNEYGASEIGVVAFEDPSGRWRLSSENVYVEVVDEGGRPVEDGQAGQILVTDLFNRAMPFVRYRVGDVGVLQTRPEIAGNGPELVSLDGRINDTILLPSGRKAAGLTFYYVARSLLAGAAAPREFVIRQTAMDEFVFDVVSDVPLSDQNVRTIQEKMVLYLEPGLRLRINPVAAIPRLPSGKRKHFFSEIAPPR